MNYHMSLNISIINWYCKVNMTISCNTQWVKAVQLRNFMVITHLSCVHFFINENNINYGLQIQISGKGGKCDLLQAIIMISYRKDYNA